MHGDYYLANILRDGHGLRILDWETFGWGDPMWDFGLLVWADRGLDREETSATIAAYEQGAPVDPLRLRWHVNRWSAHWRCRDEQQRRRTEEDGVDD